MVAFLSIVIVYMRYIYLAVLSMLRITNTSSIIQASYAVVGIISIIIYLKDSIIRSKLRDREVGLLSALIAFFLLMIFQSQNKYGYMNDAYKSMIYMAGSNSIPAFLLGILVKKDNKLDEMYKWLPVFILIMTVFTFIVTINPTGSTGGKVFTGYMKDDSGFGYQSASYSAAYAFGLNIIYINYFDKFEQFRRFKSKTWKTIFSLLMIVQILTVFISGGRGGFVVLCVFILYYMVISSRNVIYFLRKAFVFSFLIGIALIVMNLLNVTTSGFERIVDLLETRQDGTLRSTFQEAAIAMWKRHIFVGNGIGSVFYIAGYYSHNIFTDLLCEMGIIGTGAFVLIMYRSIVTLRKLAKDNPLNHLIVIVFLSGFIMLQFSLYYMAVPSIWFAMSYALYKNNKQRLEE